MTNPLSFILYLENDLMCITLLLYIIFKSFHHVERRQNWYLFRLAMCFITLFTVSDLAWAAMESGFLPMYRLGAHLSNCIYFGSCIAGTYAWFLYTERELDTGLIDNRIFVRLSRLPLIFTLLLLASNAFNGCVFRLDEHNVYSRGPLHILTFLFPCFYLIFSVFHSLTQAFQKENYVKKESYINLSMFTLITTVPAALQVLIPGTPLSCMGLSMAVLLVYINSQEMLVSIDPLTQLNNRLNMTRFLSSKIEQRNSDIPLYLFLTDLDLFKQINDTYGHVEGDNALVLFASVLRQTAARFGCFVARYGGDEFVLICESDQKDIVEQIRDFIAEGLRQVNQTSQKPYQLASSIGAARYTADLQYIPDFIAMADRSLYEVKRARKASRETEPH